MKGRILGFSGEEGTGVINAEDGKRYTFDAKEWKSGQAVRPGIQVDFEPDGTAAGGIYPDTNASLDLSALKEFGERRKGQASPHQFVGGSARNRSAPCVCDAGAHAAEQGFLTVRPSGHFEHAELWRSD